MQLFLLLISYAVVYTFSAEILANMHLFSQSITVNEDHCKNNSSLGQ